ncbi:beta-hexosaminidase [Psychromonas sp. PRT-SC03]|nr:beta-hexosaminidase [Psychromonas sp. PRT-SC03]KPU82142.1 beta-hexosaminidase [Psychromonas sp. PRT-SC03]
MRPLILDVKGCELDIQDREILAHPLVAGVILFTRNFDNIKQLKSLVQQIRLAARNDILIAVDHEGGRVQRFKEGFTILPAVGSLIALNPENKALELAFSCGYIMASELISCDIDLSFAPVLDLNGISDVIGQRAFSASPLEVVTLARAYIQGMKKAGMLCTAKHFPGHGSVKADSHISLPIDDRSQQEIFNSDILPFKRLIEEGILDAMMPSHVVYPQCDSQPAGFSQYWLQTILRQQLNFKGVIISDDLSMHGASFMGDHVDRARSAIDAGCDLILACNDIDAAITILDNLKIQNKNETFAVKRLSYSQDKRKFILQDDPLWQKCHAQLQSFNALI